LRCANNADSRIKSPLKIAAKGHIAMGRRNGTTPTFTPQ
jgi:hypothetical protein